MSSKEKRVWDSLTAEEQQEFWNGMSQSEQIAFAQAMERPQQVQLTPDQTKVTKSSLFQEGSKPIFTYTEAMKTSAAGDFVSPPSIGFSAHTNKIILAMAFVVVVLVVVCVKLSGPAHQSWTPMTILSDSLGRLERFGADVAE